MKNYRQFNHHLNTVIIIKTFNIDTLKNKKVELEEKISIIDSELASMENSISISETKKTELQTELSKINTFLTKVLAKESEFDALFNS